MAHIERCKTIMKGPETKAAAMRAEEYKELAIITPVRTYNVDYCWVEEGPPQSNE